MASGGTLAEVQDKLRRQRMAPDALIIDYQLTAITGLQVIDQLRAAHGRQLPALIITGTANLTLLQQRAPGIPVAIKVLDTQLLAGTAGRATGAKPSKAWKQLSNEIAIMKQVAHVNCVRLFEVVQNGGRLSIIRRRARWRMTPRE